MNIVLTGGGTAGHVFPAIIVGMYLKEKYDADLSFIGNKNHIEADLARKYKIPFYHVPSQGFEGKNAIEKFLGFGHKNISGVKKASSILKGIAPDYIFATGGFATAPVLAAANLHRIPYAIHEQNSVMGKVNKLFSKGAQQVFHSFPVIEKRKDVYSGIPVRYTEKLPYSGEELLFLGGSGGSLALNEFAVKFARNNSHIPCVLVCGRSYYEKMIEEEKPQNLKLIDFEDDMSSLYKRAKLVVARSGAGTIFELGNLSIPSIFVPLPTSAENHQLKNADFFAQERAAVLVEQTDDFEEKLSHHILDLWGDDFKRENMKKKMDTLVTDTRESQKNIAEVILNNLSNN